MPTGPNLRWQWITEFTKAPKKTLPPLSRTILFAIAHHLNADDIASGCFPSVDTLAKVTGMSRRSVLNHIETAKKAGFIDVERKVPRYKNGAASGRYPVNHYIPRFPLRQMELGAGDAPSLSNERDQVHVVHEPGARGGKNQVHEVHPNKPYNKSIPRLTRAREVTQAGTGQNTTRLSNGSKQLTQLAAYIDSLPGFVSPVRRRPLSGDAEHPSATHPVKPPTNRQKRNP